MIEQMDIVKDIFANQNLSHITPIIADITIKTEREKIIHILPKDITGVYNDLHSKYFYVYLEYECKYT